MNDKEVEIVARWLYGRDGMGMPAPRFDTLSADMRARYTERGRSWLADHAALLYALRQSDAS